MRSMWKGAISFGMVMIPVRLYAATEQREVTFRQVHQADGGRIRFRRVCSVCGEEVPFGDVAKGYELPGGEMVILTEDDLAGLPLPTSHSIEVVNFTPAGQLDPLQCGRSYYTEPEPAGLRAYALLRNALAGSGKVAIARVALRQRESLAALRTRDGLLVLETLLWPDEVRSPDFGFLDRDVEVKPQELRMASSLIDSMTEDFDPSRFRDGYREALEQLVAAKLEGHEVARPQPRAEAPGSLAEALRASLEAAGRGQEDGGKGRRRAPADGRRAARRPAPGASKAAPGASKAAPGASKAASGDGKTARGGRTAPDGGRGRQRDRRKAS